MSKNATLGKKGQIIYPKTKWENIIDAPTLESINQMRLDIDYLMEHGGGGGGIPINPVTEKAIYYGGSPSEIEINGSTSNIINTLNEVFMQNITEVYCNFKYYYIAMPVTYTLSKVITENNEVITDLFILKGNYLQDNESYKLYEFHLSSDIPLNTNINITISE